MKELENAVKVFKELLAGRRDWDPSLQEIKKYILPFRGLFEEVGKEKSCDDPILNGSGMRAVRTMAATISHMEKGTSYKDFNT